MAWVGYANARIRAQIEPLLQQALRARGWIDSDDRPIVDVDAFADLLLARRLCEPGVPIAVARAPGRLDVMGGIADYSGSLVLERPIAEATWVASADRRPVLDVVSLGRSPLTIPLKTLAPDGVPIGYDQAADVSRWRNVGGEWPACCSCSRERAVPLRFGLRIVVWSTVPEGRESARRLRLKPPRCTRLRRRSVLK